MPLHRLPRTVLAWLAVATNLTALAAAAEEVGARGSYQTLVAIEAPTFHTIAPRLTLSYDSNAGNGPVGIGWRLDGESRITRSTSGNGSPRYDGSDRLWIDGVELVPCAGLPQSVSCRAGGTHSPTIEDGRRYRQETQPPSNRWIVWQRDGTRLTYSPQLGDITLPNRTLRWALAEVTDTHGNRVAVTYNCNSHECLMATISYGDGASCTAQPDRPIGTVLPGTLVEFYWEARPDPVSLAQGGFLEEIDRRLRAIDISEGGQRVRTYQLSYQPEPAAPGGYRLNRSWLASIQVFGRDAVVQPDGTVSAGTALPAHTFRSPAQVQAPPAAFLNTQSASEFLPAQPTNDALPGIYNARLVRSLPPTTVIRGTSDSSVPVTTSQPGVTVGDFDGDTRLDFLQWTLNGSCTELQTRAVLGRFPMAGGVDHFNPWLGPRDCKTRATRGLAADLDGDRRTDVMFLQYRKVDPTDLRDPTYEADVVALISNGDGTFTESGVTVLWLSEDRAQILKSRCSVGDPNGDGRADMVCLTRQPAGWTIVQGLSMGSGLLRLRQEPAPTGLGDDQMMALGDANGDGLSDVFVLDQRGPANARTLDLRVGVSRSDGTYVWREQPAGLPAPDPTAKLQLLTGDFNGDRRTDLLLVMSTSNSQSGSFTTFTSSGGATADYAIAHQAFASEMPAVSIGDRDGDGLDDVFLAFHHRPHGGNVCNFALAGDHASTTWVFSRDGRLTFPSAAAQCYDETTFFADDWISPENPFTTQVNGDHRADVFQYLAPPVPGVGSYVIKDLVAPISPDDAFVRWRQTDVDGDGRPDWVFAAFGNPGLIVTTLLSRPDGTHAFVTRTIPSTAGDFASVDAVANWYPVDVAGPNSLPDGRADLVVIDDNRQRIVTLVGAGDGTWTPVATSYVASVTTHQGHALTGRGDRFNWRPVDVNGDGLTDLVHTAQIQAAAAGGSLRVDTLIARGDGTWKGPIEAWQYSNVYDDANVHDFMTGDVDGDGRTDLVLVETYAGRPVSGNNNTLIRTLLASDGGTWREVPSKTLQQPFLATKNWRLADVNGDGRVDLVYVSSEPGAPLTVSYLLSLGNGSWDDIRNTPVVPNPVGVDTSALRDLRIVDLDHDGLHDFVFVVNVVGAAGRMATATVIVWNRFPAFVPTITTDLAAASTDTSSWEVTDANGDDQPELVRLRRVVPFLIDVISVPVLQQRLMLRSNGMGGSEEMTYATSTGAHRLMPIGSLARVVSSVSVRAEDGAAPVSLTRYTYTGATYLYGALRQFVGFERVEAADGQRIVGTDNVLNARCGALTRVSELMEPDRTLLRRESRTYNGLVAQPSTQTRCSEDASGKEEWERTAAPRMSTTTTTYDAFMNVATVREGGMATDPGDDRLFETAVNPLIDAAHFIVDRPAFRRVTGFDAQGVAQVLAETRYEYDHSGDYRNPPVDRGELSREIRLDLATNREAPTTYEYDARGNVTRVSGPPLPSNAAGVSMTVEYDCEFARFPEKVCDGQSCATSSWDKTLSVVREVRDANNALITFDVDALRRPEMVHRPDGGFERWRWPLLADWNTSRQILTHEISDASPNDGVRWTRIHVDGLGRIADTMQEGGAVQEIEYDGASSRVAALSAPHLATEPAQTTRYGFDAAGRISRIEHPDHSMRRTLYSVGRTTTVGELGATLGYETDPFGRITAVTENLRNCIGEGCPIAESGTTWYRYDALDRLVLITDAAKHDTSLLWSAFGPIRSCDPDRGCVATTWNLDGTLEAESDATGSRTNRYDALGRIEEREVHDAGGIRTRLVRWTWDVDPQLKTPRGASLGHVTQVNETAHGARIESKFRYDVMGHAERTDTCVDRACSTVMRDFDVAGRIRALRLRANLRGRPVSMLALSYEYDEAGMLRSVPGYLRRLQYDAAGRLTYAQAQNHVVELRSYDPAREWTRSVTVQSFRANGAPLRPLFKETREYDLAGRLFTDAITGVIGARTDTYTHDDLGRLRVVTSTDPARARTFDFDLTGNLTVDSVLGTVTRNDPAHVHAMTDTASGEHREYDAVGQMLTSNALEIAWNPERRPVRLTERATATSTQLEYDVTGRLVKRATATDAVWSPDPMIDVDSKGSVVFWISALGRRVARSEAGVVRFLHPDALGSTRLVTDQTGRAVAHQDYGVWGEHVAALGAGGNRTFGGGLRTEPGALILLGARFYDAPAGQFVSADPIVPALYVPQSLNRYRFALNDPVTLVDPTGYAPEGFMLWGDAEQGHMDATAEWEQWPGSDSAEWEPYPRLSPPPMVRSWDVGWYPWITNRTTARDMVPPATPQERHDEGPQLWAPQYRNPAPVFYDMRDDMLQQALRAPLAAAVLESGAVLAMADGLGIGEALSQRDYLMVGIGTLSAVINIAAMSRVREIGSPQKPMQQSRQPGTPFNPEPWVDPANCVKCVASLLDSIFNEDFVQQANEYPSTQANAGRMPRALQYLHKQVGVEFGPQQTAVPGGYMPPGDYVVFTDFVQGRPGHILFGRSVEGQMNFYDPQLGKTTAPNGYYVLYQVRYPE